MEYLKLKLLILIMSLTSLNGEIWVIKNINTNKLFRYDNGDVIVYHEKDEASNDVNDDEKVINLLDIKELSDNEIYDIIYQVECDNIK